MNSLPGTIHRSLKFLGQIGGAEASLATFSNGIPFGNGIVMPIRVTFLAVARHSSRSFK